VCSVNARLQLGGAAIHARRIFVHWRDGRVEETLTTAPRGAIIKALNGHVAVRQLQGRAG
jgi:hypothetical protein